MNRKSDCGNDRANLLRRPINLSVSGKLLEEARALEINISKACERGLAAQIAEVRAAKWLEENREGIEAYNAYVERHGLPLARFRRF